MQWVKIVLHKTAKSCKISEIFLHIQNSGLGSMTMAIAYTASKFIVTSCYARCACGCKMCLRMHFLLQRRTFPSKLLNFSSSYLRTSPTRGLYLQHERILTSLRSPARLALLHFVLSIAEVLQHGWERKTTVYLAHNESHLSCARFFGVFFVAFFSIQVLHTMHTE